jgi:hypothetical protein
VLFRNYCDAYLAGYITPVFPHSFIPSITNLPLKSPKRTTPPRMTAGQPERHFVTSDDRSGFCAGLYFETDEELSYVASSSRSIYTPRIAGRSSASPLQHRKPKPRDLPSTSFFSLETAKDYMHGSCLHQSRQISSNLTRSVSWLEEV